MSPLAALQMLAKGLKNKTTTLEYNTTIVLSRARCLSEQGGDAVVSAHARHGQTKHKVEHYSRKAVVDIYIALF